jgi:magnesium transporter
MALELIKPAAEAAPSAPAATPAPEPGVVAASVYAGGRRVCETTVDRAGAWAKRAGHVVWIGLYEPSAELLRRVQAQFDLHEMAIEDAEQPHQRPKLEQYGEALFIVARTAQLVDRRIAFGETHVFVGRGYVVSVRHGASTSYSGVRAHCEACATVLSHGEDYILYAMLDFIVGNYEAVIEAVHAEVDEIEDSVFAATLPEGAIQRLYTLRRDLLRLRNAALPLIEVCRRLEHAEARRVDAAMLPLFRDVTDHVHRVQEEVDSLREVLAFAFEASLMTGQAQQAHITRRLAAWAAILAVPTAVAGIYGMNFDYMPELTIPAAYFVVLMAVVTICSVLYWRFRKHGWL